MINRHLQSASSVEIRRIRYGIHLELIPLGNKAEEITRVIKLPPIDNEEMQKNTFFLIVCDDVLAHVEEIKKICTSCKLYFILDLNICPNTIEARKLWKNYAILGEEPKENLSNIVSFFYRQVAPGNLISFDYTDFVFALRKGTTINSVAISYNERCLTLWKNIFTKEIKCVVIGFEFINWFQDEDNNGKVLENIMSVTGDTEFRSFGISRINSEENRAIAIFMT